MEGFDIIKKHLDAMVEELRSQFDNDIVKVKLYVDLAGMRTEKYSEQLMQEWYEKDREKWRKIREENKAV